MPRAAIAALGTSVPDRVVTNAELVRLMDTSEEWIVQRTGNLKAAQELLGHTTSTITSRHYAHLMTDHLRDAVASLNSTKKAKK